LIGSAKQVNTNAALDPLRDLPRNLPIGCSNVRRDLRGPSPRYYRRVFAGDPDEQERLRRRRKIAEGTGLREELLCVQEGLLGEGTAGLDDHHRSLTASLCSGDAANGPGRVGSARRALWASALAPPGVCPPQAVSVARSERREAARIFSSASLVMPWIRSVGPVPRYGVKGLCRGGQAVRRLPTR
jgi:hypothetical protein